MTDGPNTVILQITFTNHDVEVLAVEAGIDKDDAMRRALDWAEAISDEAILFINEQLYSAIHERRVHRR